MKSIGKKIQLGLNLFWPVYMYMSYFFYKDMPLGLLDDIYDFISKFGQRLDEVDDVLTENRIWKARTIDVGIISSEDALNYGFRYSICLEK